MRLPTALEQWAAEHNDQLSADTLDEVRIIAAALTDSPLAERSISEPIEDLNSSLNTTFSPPRAERAATLLRIVATWADKRPSDPPRFQPAAVALPLVESSQSPYPEEIGAPALFGSDRVDEEDQGRLYGPNRPWKAIGGTVLSLVILAGVAAAGWYWFSQRDASSETAQSTDEATTQQTPEDQATNGDASTDQGADDQASNEQVAGDGDDAAPTTDATQEPESLAPTAWADTMPILNSGTAEILASTYAVSPANRAVLTGHTAAITGIVISDDGRVLTSGADRRLVDWGADVTLANPDVLNVPSPLTVLERTADQLIIAGDTDGNVTIISLVDESDPIILPVHDVAISAAAELSDGRLAVASVDGDISVFAINEPNNAITLNHATEITAVIGLPNGRLAAAAVDGTVLLWSADSGGELLEISTLESPVTSLALLADGRLATASLTGAIHIVSPESPGESPIVLPGHVGAVRALYEITMPDGEQALVSGGDDTTLRLWNVADQTQRLVLEGHGDIISGLDSLPDGRLVSASGDGTGRVWDLTLEPSRPVIAPHTWNLSAIYPWKNDQFVTGGIDGKIVLASTSETTEPVLISEHQAPIVGVVVFGDTGLIGETEIASSDIVSLDALSVLHVTSAQATAPYIEITVAPGATALDLHPQAGLVTGHADGTVRVHDLTQETATIEAHGSGVNHVAVLSSGLIASAGQDNTVRIIDLDDPGTLPVFDLHTGPVDVVIELPDGRIASAGSDGIYVYSAEGLAQDHVRLNGQRSRTISLVGLGQDRLISTGDDGRVRLWDLTTPEAEPVTLIDIPGVVNPYLSQADNGLFVAGAARGYVVFSAN